jgi:hypothetical protein
VRPFLSKENKNNIIKKVSKQAGVLLKGRVLAWHE